MSSETTKETITLETSRFGQLEVPKASIITVVNGVIGFPEWIKYTLLEYNPPFSWLQSVENGSLAFVVVNGAEFGDDYSFPLPIGDRDLDLKEDDDVAVVNLVSVRPNPTETTVNLKAPIIVNLRTLKGRQLVLDDSRFPVRMPLWSPDEKQAEEGQTDNKR
jgi:flagellar assembly factor FliW